ncbi:MAG: exostosin family protein [Hyphomicrobiaceae bacterium]
MSVIEERKTWQLRERYKHVFREEPPGKPASEASRLFLTGCPKVTNAIASPSPTSRQRQHFVDDKHKLISYDQGWQFPAITEQHAFERIREWIVEQEAVTFVAYPWATLIDKLQVEAVDAKAHVASFRKFCARIPTTGIKVTVCQQILLKRFHYLFKEAKITHVFWSHASVGDVDNDDLQGLELIPFPLYPVQIPSALKGATIDQDYAERRYLFSFVGARANRYYPKQTRNWIIDELAHVPKGLIAGRDQWFYQKIVYDHQIRGTAAQVPPDKLLKQNEATAFRETLLQSTFSLCPAGTGPNSIRLWESIGAGAIPVILADTWAPPGNRALWEEAAVFCPETPEDVKALPDRLAAIAADPAHLAAKRHAMRQLWMLYGPENFVHDIQKFVLQKATENAAQTPAIVVPDRVRQLARAVLTTDPTPRAASLALVSAEATDRLLTAAKDTSLWADDPEIARACGRALEAIGADHALARNLARTRARARSRGAGPAKFGRRPSVFLFGRHAHRTPLAYAPYRTLAAPLLDLVERPEDADVLVSGFSIDLADNIEAVRAYQARNPSLRLVVLSEEPLWDTMWSGGYAEQVAMRTIDGAALTYRVINHVTSDVYRFARIPYFVTTSDDYIARYMHLFERNRSLSPREVLDVWRHASVRMAFFVEKRDDPKYDVVDRACDIFGLSRFRTRLAETAPAEGLLRIGNGWDAPRPRQALPDWHLDKLATLDKRCSIVSGLENTHQRDYISEKIFDAFAVQALPIYFASPRHRIHEIIPEGSFVNVYGLAPEEAQAKIAALLPDLALAERYVEAQNRLWELFRDVDALVAERLRLTEAVAAALTSVLEGSTSETEMLLSAAK